MAVIYLHREICQATLKRLRTLLYGAHCAVDPTQNLRYAARIIGRELTHDDILEGNLTEREGRQIIKGVSVRYPSFKKKILSRFLC